MPEGGQGETFETIDWEDHQGRKTLIELPTAAFGVLLALLIGLYLYDYFFVLNAYTLVLGIRPNPLEWLVAFALTFLVSYGVIPILMDPSRLRHYWRTVRETRMGTTSSLFLVAAVIIAVAGPEILGPPTTAQLPFTAPEARPPTSGLPPPFVGGVPMESVLYCSGTVQGGACYGDIAHPFGTTPSGRDVLTFVVGGFRVALEVAVLTSVLLVPVATVAGTSAAYLGGRVDAVLTRSADFLQVVPVIVIYLFVRLLFGAELWLLVVLFGLLGWGQIARQVRAEVLSLRDAGYVRAARDAGASPSDTVRRHLIPNVSHIAVAALAIQVPKLIVAEVTLAYLGLVQTEVPTWGFAIAAAIDDPTLPIQTIGGISPLRVWWAFTFPLLALVATTIAVTVLAGALGDALDPRAGVS